MRRVLFLFTLALVVAVPASQDVSACGNKFLQISFAMLQQRYAPSYSASILVFAPSRSGGKSLLKEQKFQSALQKAGHKLVVVQDEAGLSNVLQTSRFDLALVGLADLAVLGSKTASAASTTTLLPVTNKEPKGEVAACRKQYDCQLKMSDRLDEFLKTMDSVMKTRMKPAGRTR